MSDEGRENGRYHVPALEKAIAILDLLARSDKPLGITELHANLNIAKATIFTILVTLEHHQIIRRAGAGGYAIGPRLYELGNAFVGNLDIVQIAQPHLADLMARTELTTNLAMLDRGEVLIVDRLEPPSFIRFWTFPGLRIPIHTCALGKAIAAYLPASQVEEIVEWRGMVRYTEKTITSLPELKKALEAVRARGYAIEDEEGELNVGCIGAPIFDASRRVVAAVSVTGLISRLRPWPAPELGATVRSAADRISLSLGAGSVYRDIETISSSSYESTP